MSNPRWVDDTFAVLMLVVATYSAGRLVASRMWSRPIHRDVDVAHVLMGTAMAGMLVADLNPFPDGVWELVFSGLAGWFVWRCLQFVRDPGLETYYHEHVHRLSRRVIHLVMSLAMLYMYLAASPLEARSGGSMAMGPATGATADFALLPAGFVVALLVSAIWQLDALGRFASAEVVVASPDSVVTGTSTLVGARNESIFPRGGSVGTEETSATGTQPPPWLAPRLEALSHIAMALTMVYMLVLML